LELYDLSVGIDKKNTVAGQHAGVVARRTALLNGAWTESADYPPEGTKKK
jgi:hypothetical protein